MFSHKKALSVVFLAKFGQQKMRRLMCLAFVMSCSYNMWAVFINWWQTIFVLKILTCVVTEGLAWQTSNVNTAVSKASVISKRKKREFKAFWDWVILLLKEVAFKGDTVPITVIFLWWKCTYSFMALHCKYQKRFHRL